MIRGDRFLGRVVDVEQASVGGVFLPAQVPGVAQVVANVERIVVHALSPYG